MAPALWCNGGVSESTTRSMLTTSAQGVALRLERMVLVVTEGPEAGLERALTDQPVILGRSETADLVFRDPSVSREHLRLEPSGTGYRVVDLESRSGTFVEKVRVRDADLAPDQTVRLGSSAFVLRSRTDHLPVTPPRRESFAGVIGNSRALADLLSLVEKVAPLDLPLLLQGETGTGKELLARAIHRLGRDPEGPYQVVDCTQLSDPETARSELFGHVEGAYTGAGAARQGAFVAADGGTLFLDEIGELPAAIQSQLLRALQEGEVRPLGSTGTLRVRVRVVSASHRDLAARVAEGTFRADLFFRLSAVVLDVPPLRARGDDLFLLAREFLPAGISLADDAKDAMRAHAWPGNIRELAYVLRGAAAVSLDGILRARDLRIGSAPRTGWSREAGEIMRAQRERTASLTDAEIEVALDRCGGNRNRAARMLGIGRATLYRRLTVMRGGGEAEPEE